MGATVGTTDDFVNNYTCDYINRMTSVTQHGVTGGLELEQGRLMDRLDLGHDEVRPLLLD